MSRNPKNATLTNPPDLGDPSRFAYSQLGIVPDGHLLVFVAGQGGHDPAADEPPPFGEQCDRALADVATAMKAAGGDLSDVVKVTVLVVGLTDDRHAALTAALKKAFSDGRYPTSTLIPVPRLSSERMLVEIEAIGAVDAKVAS